MRNPKSDKSVPQTASVSSLPEHGRMGVRHDERYDNAAGVMAELLPGLGLLGRVLVVDDDGDTVVKAAHQLGAEVMTWYRRALGGHAARPWVGEGPFDAVIVHYPVSRGAFKMILHAVAPRLATGGRLFAYGANDEGIKGSPRALEAVFQGVETVATKRHSRVMLASGVKEVAFKKDLSDWKERVTLAILGGPLELSSYPGLFAHGRLDAGTALLLQVLPPTLAERAKVLDYGCGIGTIGLAVQRAHPSIELEMVDFDAVATYAAKVNAPQASVFTADSLAPVRGKKYDLIVSNPPIHAGKGEDFTVILRFLSDAAAALAPGGELLFVVQATVPIQKELTKLFGQVEPTLKDKQFTVWKCSAPLRQ